jgi:hypothetical protein
LRARRTRRIRMNDLHLKNSGHSLMWRLIFHPSTLQALCHNIAV